MWNLYHRHLFEVLDHAVFSRDPNVSGQQKLVFSVPESHNQAVVIVTACGRGSKDGSMHAFLVRISPQGMKTVFCWQRASRCPKRVHLNGLNHGDEPTQVIDVGVRQKDRIEFTNAISSEPMEQTVSGGTPIDQPPSAIGK